MWEQYVPHEENTTRLNRGFTSRNGIIMNLNDFQTQAVLFAKSCIDEAVAKGTNTMIGDWSMTDLVGHLCMVNVMCASSLAGHGPELLPPSEEVVGQDPFAALAKTSTEFVTSFAAASDKSITCPTPVGPFPAWVVQTQGSMEHLIHACDVIHSFGLPRAVPDSLVAEGSTRILINTALYDKFRSMGMYAAPVAVAPDASSLTRMLAYLGR
jgi:uncharacterized protein (TIGR03086 family)